MIPRIHWVIYVYGAILSYHATPGGQLREYPASFGFKLVDMYGELVRSSRGQAPLPTPLPAAMASFKAMPDSGDCLEFAGLHEVFNYLRRNRHLRIPAHWRDLIPKPMDD